MHGDKNGKKSNEQVQLSMSITVKQDHGEEWPLGAVG